MIDFLASFGLTPAEWTLFVLCALLMGTAKTGVAGAGMAVVPVVASIFGGRPSVGIMLPILCMADVFAVSYYHRHAEWGHVLRLMPWALAGILLGVYVGAVISAEQFRTLLAVVILAGVGLILWRERKGDAAGVPFSRWFAALMGLAAGFTTMIGNAAGPIMAMYLLAMRLPKYSYIGTGAWYFMILNLTKVPFHVFVWGTITILTFLLDLAMLPAIAVGAVLGVWIVRLIPEKYYRMFIIVMTVLGALKLFF